MGLAGAKDIELRFAGYVEGLVSGGHHRMILVRDEIVRLARSSRRRAQQPVAWSA
jgi:hypothetical protein